MINFKLGGYLKESKVSEPYKRYHDDHPIKVNITVLKFHGIGIHYYCTIKEEPNFIWEEESQTWTEFWDDPYKLREFQNGNFLTVEDARKWIQETLNENFEPGTYFVSEENNDDTWFYKDGD